MPTHPSQAHQPSKPITTLRSVDSQASKRRLATVYDQHKSARFPRGRPWWGHLEKPADSDYDPSFCCELTPGDTDDPFGSTWSAPWLPDQLATDKRAYYRIDVVSRKLTWMYATIIADDIAANSRYWEAAYKIAHENGWPMPHENQPPTFQIRSILFNPPRSPKIAEAALAGDHWILGNTDQVNEELSAILKGTLVRQQPVVTPEMVLSDDARIQAIVAKAVADALAKQDEARKAKKAGQMANARGARHPKKSPSAAPGAATAA